MDPIRHVSWNRSGDLEPETTPMPHATTPNETKLFSRPGLSGLLWPARAERRRIELFDLDISDDTLDEAVAHLADAAAAGRRTTVAFVNAHAVNAAMRDPVYGRVLAAADRRYADGSGLAVAARMAGRPLRDNVNGTDLLPAIAERAVRDGLKLYLLGGRDGVAKAAAATLVARFPGLVIAGTHHGYFTPGSHEETLAIAAVNASGADILLVGFGVPLQDRWLAENRDALTPPVRLGVGGLFDFFSGRIPRAPFVLRRLGQEWIYRLIQEPRRMWKRYLVGNAVFLGHAARQAVSARLGREDAPLSAFASWRAALGARLPTAARDATKRALDIAGAGLGLLMLSPVFAAAALAIKLESKGPVFFRQTRIGRDGKPFTMLKFRSMFTGADLQHATLQGEVKSAHDVRFKMKRDPRVTGVGRVLRRASLDELPQLVNVLKGDMSIVGPRPALPSEVARYSPSDRDRLLAKPGITCTWQVSGRADIDFVGQVVLDRDYVRNRSTKRDIALILETIPAVVSGRGAY